MNLRLLRSKFYHAWYPKISLKFNGVALVNVIRHQEFKLLF